MIESSFTINNHKYIIRDVETGGALTNKAWQQLFRAIRDDVEPSDKQRMRKKILFRPHQEFELENAKEYTGENNYNMYCDFINDVLSTIRKGKTDFCYHIYQIADLLRFEHDRLRSEYLEADECFKVWLAK